MNEPTSLAHKSAQDLLYGIEHRDKEAANIDKAIQEARDHVESLEHTKAKLSGEIALLECELARRMAERGIEFLRYGHDGHVNAFLLNPDRNGVHRVKCHNMTHLEKPPESAAPADATLEPTPDNFAVTY